MIVCPSCNSSRIAHFRLDSDWGYGGDWYEANERDDAGYTPDDIASFDENERPDISCKVCCACGACFD